MLQRSRLRFTDAKNGYLVGNELKVHRTTAGGATWAGVDVKLASTATPSFPLIHDIDFGTLTHGALVGRTLNGGAFVAVTTDGGKTWKLETMPGDKEYSEVNDITECLDYPGPTAYAGTANGKTWQLKNDSAGGKRAPRYGAVTPDAGLPSDGGQADSAAPSMDLGATDSGAPSKDSGTTGGGGGGGGCSVAASRPGMGLLALLALALLGLRRRGPRA